MSKITTVLALGTVCSLSANANEQSAYITEYCGAKHYEYSHNITIGEVQGIATHRDGYLQVNDSSNDDALKWELLKLSALITNPEECLTYISNLGIAKFGEPTDKGYLVARVHFAFDKYNITPLAKKVLAGVAQQLAANNFQVTVEGHTDWVGSESYNQALGMRRAESTAGQLRGYGVTKQNTTIKSFGESEPIASNSNADGRSQNRRSDVYIPLDSEVENQQPQNE
ncbi:outer membrane lipoprotein precursor OmpA family [Vibrio maritimus]|uniref:Outer membrane lipoprotein OmpA family n=1 Tax=Vibrio maritimus TaxID=990268 RepID=A0A090TT95_9VIBR|nr:outer membrane lipoprotein precursor OmpA family [Vibrio maritimus]